MISLGVLDDEMTPGGPTEADPSFVNHTGFSKQEMLDMTAAFQNAQDKLLDKVIAMGGFSWYYTHGSALIDTIRLNNDTAACITTLHEVCQWYGHDDIGSGNSSAMIYYVNPADAMAKAERYVAEFLL